MPPTVENDSSSRVATILGSSCFKEPAAAWRRWRTCLFSSPNVLSDSFGEPSLVKTLSRALSTISVNFVLPRALISPATCGSCEVSPYFVAVRAIASLARGPELALLVAQLMRSPSTSAPPSIRAVLFGTIAARAHNSRTSSFD